jgi:cytosine/adenosine deaminase-related metal-dependent hydrolase
VHVGVDPADRGRVAEVAARGLLGADVTLVHCCEVDDADLDAIAANGATVALSPPTEMARGLGPPPLQAMLDRGIRPGLAVDDELMASGDLFARMRSVQSLQRALVFDRKLAGKAGLPDLLSTREVIRYATVDGARVAGLDEITGSLAPGKQADVIVLRADRPNIAPVNDPIGAVVWGMDPSNVDWVFVAGRPLVRAGVLDADTTRVRDLAVAARQRLTTAAAGAVLETSEGGPS